MSSLKSAKHILRQSIRESLKRLTNEEIQDKSKELTAKLLKEEVYQKANRISVYLSMPQEVDTTLILKDIFASKKQCYVPRVDGNCMDMLHVHSMSDVSTLPVHKWNFRQPGLDEDRENALDTEGLDLIIVPGLGFTEDGKRLGQGKGYYDTYIAKCLSAGFKPSTIGLAFNIQKCTDLPTDSTDITIDHVIFA
jgi:5-formyltetrahydrofolate cyclo-ligase